MHLKEQKQQCQIIKEGRGMVHLLHFAPVFLFLIFILVS